MLKWLIAGLLISFGALTSVSGLAQNAPQPARPLIFIPGIIGSEIWINDERVWGSLTDMAKLEKLKISDGPRDAPAAPNCSTQALRDATKREVCGIVESFVLLPPFKLNQYGGLITFLEKELGYRRSGENRTLYIFPYDWRRSNFETAKALHEFIATERGLVGREFDVLAHSMGGLISLIYSHVYDSPPPGRACGEVPNTCRMQSVLTMGTPFFGSVSAVATADTGWGSVANWFVGGQKTITDTILSWPSVYEMLPIYEQCCTSLVASRRRQMTLTSFDDWKQLPYLTGAGAPRPERVRAALESRLKLAKLAEERFPRHLTDRVGPCDQTGNRFFAIAGDRYKTNGRFILSDGQLQYEYLRGDETVLLRSAAQGDVGRSFVSFSSHQKIFDDEHVREALRRILHRCTLKFQDFNADALSVELERRAGGPRVRASVYAVGVKMEPTVLIIGESLVVTAEIDLETHHDVFPPAGRVSLSIDGESIFEGEVKMTSAGPAQDPSRTLFRYSSSVVKIVRSGRVNASVRFDSIPAVEDQTVAFDRHP